MKRFSILVCSLFMLSSCTSELDQLFNLSRPEVLVAGPVFYATTESSSIPETKTFADSQMRVLWNAGDQISIFNKITYNQGFEFDGDDGDTAGGFNPFTQMPMFGSWEDLDYIYAVYPYSTNNKCGYDGDLTVMLPAEQSYKESSFGIGANTMVAVTEGSRLRFKNVGGYLSLRLYGDNVKVSSVTIKGNNGEKIAGKATVTIPLDGTPTTVMDNSATDAITIVCNPEVQLGADAEHYTDFWFVIPPVTFTNGFTITVIDDQGGVFEKATTRSLTVVRNQLDWMDPLEVKIENNGSGIIIGDDLEQLYQVVNDFIQEINWASDHPYGMTVNDSIRLFEGLIEFARVRESSINYAFDPSLDSRDRRYFKYCTGYYNKPIIDSIKFTDITWNDFRSHGLDLTTTCLENYDEGEVVRCSIFKSISLQLFNSVIADLFYEEVEQGWRWMCVHKLIDLESAINADNYNAFFGKYRYDDSLGAIVPLDGYDNEVAPFLDANFKAYCIESFDTDRDGFLSEAECNAVTSIEVCTDEIESLEGIELFINLEELYCRGSVYTLENGSSGRISSLDVSGNIKLKVLECQSNQLTALDFSKNPLLTKLVCNYNQITELSLPNNYALELLDLELNRLTSVDLSNCTSLKRLRIPLNNLESLDVTALSELTDLDVRYNIISSIDLRNNVKLENASLDGNNLTCLDLSQNVNLQGLSCNGNIWTIIKVTNNFGSWNMTWIKGNLTELDVTHNTKLKGLECANQQLTTLDVSNNLELNKLNCAMNPLVKMYITEGQWISSLNMPDDTIVEIKQH